MDDCEYLLNILYTSTEPNSNEPQRCVVVMDRLRAVTFRHGGHKKFTQDQITKIYPIGLPNRSIEPVNVKVVFINDTADLIVFHTIDKDFDNYPDAVGSSWLGTQYRMIGIDGKGRPNVKSGVISKERLGFVIGDNHAEDGDSGAAIIDRRNWFIGMAVGKQNFLSPPYMLKNSTLDLNQMASHFSYAKILPAQTILAHLPAEENEILDEDPPCKREKKDESKQ